MRRERAGRPSRSKIVGTGGGGGGGALAAAIMDLSPVGYWKFNETEGTTMVDSSTNANDGTYTTAYTLGGIAGADGDYTSWASPFVGGTIPHIAAYAHETLGLSIFLLVQTNLASQTREVWIKKGDGSASSSAWLLRRFALRPQLQTQTNANPPTSGARDITDVDEMTENQWMAFTGTMASNTNAQIHKIDGATVASTQGAGTGSVGTTGPFQIAGNEDDNSNQGLTGGLAHFAIFTGVLSDADLTSLHTAAAADGWI